VIQLAPTFRRAIIREMTRRAGSLGKLQFWDGAMPENCDYPADGERVLNLDLGPGFMEAIAEGTEPKLPSDATYWRVLDATGAVLMQGDGR
jgi:hypothetical protein